MVSRENPRVLAMSQSPFGLLTDWDDRAELLYPYDGERGLNRLSAC